MNCLPGFDRTTARSESAVFGALGLTGVLLVALAVAPLANIGGDGDGPPGARSGGTVSPAVAGRADPREVVATNARVIRPVGKQEARGEATTAARRASSDFELCCLAW